jgi:SSS family solute:Na+ symporter
LRVAQGLIVAWGLVGIGSAFYVASTGEALLPFLIQYTAMFLGPLLGLFLMGVLIPRINATGAFYGTIAAVLILAIGSGQGWLSFPGIWRSAIIAPVAVLLGWGISLLGAAPAPRSIVGLTLWLSNDGCDSCFSNENGHSHDNGTNDSKKDSKKEIQ